MFVQLFQRRLYIATKYAETRVHAPMIQALGVNGMSSDESDHENDHQQYRIIVKRWRHPEVTPWLRVFDKLYHRYRLSGGDMQTLQGGFPHLRVESNISSDSHPVSRLPRNAYSSQWLSSLNRLALQDLAPHADYDFKHCTEVVA